MRAKATATRISAMDKTCVSKIVRVTPAANVVSRRPAAASISSNMKAMQSAKIQEVRQALVDAGYLTLVQQSKSLGLSRSTAWTVLKGSHKCSGLSANIVKRMLSSPQLPPPAAKILLEYVEKKTAGVYGHNKDRLRVFRAQLGILCPQSGTNVLNSARTLYRLRQGCV